MHTPPGNRDIDSNLCEFGGLPPVLSGGSVPTTTENGWDLQILPKVRKSITSTVGDITSIQIPVERPAGSASNIDDYGYVLLVDDVPTNLTLFISLDAMGQPDRKKGTLTASTPAKRNQLPGSPKIVVTILTKKSPTPSLESNHPCFSR